MDFTVVIPAHNPDPDRLRRVLLGLRGQTLSAAQWHTVLVDNASKRFPDTAFFAAAAPENFAIVGEPVPGLTAARRRGFSAARGNFAVLVDDDNVLAPDYLATVLELFSQHPEVGLLGGRSLPEFATEPPAWTSEFFPLLALRDLGPAKIISPLLRAARATRNEYPTCSPIGAGMALRRAAWEAWLSRPGDSLSDRRGTELSSGGDNDIVLCAMAAGWKVGYFPELLLTHLIPASRLEATYLARLNRGIQKSWMQVLSLHDANPWPPLSSAGARVRQWKAWLVHQPWRSPARAVRWQGACGHFEGRVARSRPHE